ncbi:MAG: hypothetical protein ACI31W_02290 [Lactococcus sp.]
MTPQEAEKAKQSIKEKMSNRKLKYTITAATAVALATGAGAFAEKAKTVNVKKDPQIHHKFNKAQADIEVTSAANGLVVELGSGLQLILEGTGANKNWAITAPAGFKGSIQAHHNHKGNDYQKHVVSFSGTGEDLQKATIITGTKNLTKIKFSDLIVDTSDDAPVIAPVSLGFIGYYVHSGKIMSTSFYNIDLNEGETIDWDKVDEAYDEWVNIGGLPKGLQYKKSGVGSFLTHYNNREGLGHHTFTEDLIEGYYGRHFIDPGYLEFETAETQLAHERYIAAVDAWNKERAILIATGIPHTTTVGDEHYRALLDYYNPIGIQVGVHEYTDFLGLSNGIADKFHIANERSGFQVHHGYGDKVESELDSWADRLDAERSGWQNLAN